MVSLKRNVVLNVIRQLSAIAFPLITVPYVTRVLGVANYGMYSYSSSIISYFALLASLGIATYATREGTQKRNNVPELNMFASEVFSINIGTTILSVFLLLLLLIYIPKLYSYRIIILIQAITLFGTLIGMDWVNTIFEDYTYITIRTVVVQIISIVLMLLMVKTTSDLIKYVIITASASVGANVCNYFYVKKYVTVKPVIKCNVKKHLPTMMILFCNALAVTIYVNSDTTILGLIKGDAAVGIYAVASKIYLIIKQLLSAVMAVVFPRLSYYVGQKDEGNYNKLLNQLLNGMIVIVVPVVLGVYLISEDIIYIISGSEYVIGASALQVLSFALIFSLFGGIFASGILIPYKKDKEYMQITLIGALINVGANLLAIPHLSYFGAALTTLLAECIVCLSTFIKANKYVKIKLNIKNIVITLIGCFEIVIVYHTINSIINLIMIKVIMIVVISAILYLITMYLLKLSIVIDTLDKMKGR